MPLLLGICEFCFSHSLHRLKTFFFRWGYHDCDEVFEWAAPAPSEEEGDEYSEEQAWDYSYDEESGDCWYTWNELRPYWYDAETGEWGYYDELEQSKM